MRSAMSRASWALGKGPRRRRYLPSLAKRETVSFTLRSSCSTKDLKVSALTRLAKVPSWRKTGLDGASASGAAAALTAGVGATGETAATAAIVRTPGADDRLVRRLDYVRLVIASALAVLALAQAEPAWLRAATAPLAGLLAQLAAEAEQPGEHSTLLIDALGQALAVGDKDRFLAVELDERRIGEMPPCGRLAALILSGGDAERVKAEARRIAQAAPETDAAFVMGPAPAPLALLRGRYRERLLVKATPELDLPAWLRAWLAPIRLPGAVQLQVDVDPISFL